MIAMMLRIAVAALILLATANSPSRAAAATTPTAATGQSYASAEEAATALVDAVRSNKADAIMAVLGPGSEKLVNSGDPVIDATAREKFATSYDEKHELVAEGPDRMTLVVGSDDWPLPIPLVQSDGRWHFDSAAGAQELVDRRIGRDEIAAIRTSLTYVDAQKEYFELAQKVGGTAYYAQRLVSSPGKHDGLYWEAENGEESPFGPLVAQAREDGYPGAQASGKPHPYFGYHFRILTGQGPNSTEGAMNYIGADGEMTKGFAMIAWPASYGASGIMSFIVNQDGIVFQKDLGPDTASIAPTIKLFDPDLSWARVDIVK
jgi:hypothetical protein